MSEEKHHIKTIKRALFPGFAVTALTVSSLAVEAQTPAVPHRLVVGVTVEGLSMEYLDLLLNELGNDGLGYFLNNGVTFTDMDYGTVVDGVTANAIIHTGASPAVNGVASENIYDAATHRVVPLLNSQQPSAAEENFSPSLLLASTISDELKISGGAGSQVHSLSANPSMAVTGAGHAANTAYWINDASGRWTTSTYYQDRPAFLQYRNRMQPLDSKLDTMVWVPSAAALSNATVSPLQKEYPFRVHFAYGDPYRVSKYKSSAKVNDEITEVATEYLRNLDLGSHEAPDMLSVSYTVQPYPFGNGADEHLQIIDSYLRLDSSMEKLLRTIDETAGLDNTLIFVAGTPVAAASRRDAEKWRIPSGEFSVRKAISLLNLYLINKFGNGDWISGYHNGYFYLNGGTVSEHRADEREVRREAASFLQRMAGVTEVYTIDDILNRNVAESAGALSRNTRASTAGDIYVATAPGWNVVDQPATVPLNDRVQRASIATAPLFLASPVLETQQISLVTDARVIAPTISSLMRIRAPNGASLPPVRLLKIKK